MSSTVRCRFNEKISMVAMKKKGVCLQVAGSSILFGFSDEVFDDVAELLGFEGFSDVGAYPLGFEMHDVFLGAFGGNYDDGNGFHYTIGGHFVDHLDAVHDRHIDVDEDEIDPIVRQDIEPFLAVARLMDLTDGYLRDLERLDDQRPHG